MGSKDIFANREKGKGEINFERKQRKISGRKIEVRGNEAIIKITEENSILKQGYVWICTMHAENLIKMGTCTDYTVNGDTITLRFKSYQLAMEFVNILN